MAVLMALTAPVAAVTTPVPVTAQATTETQPVPDVTILVPVKKPTIAKAELAPSAPAGVAPLPHQAPASFAAMVAGAVVDTATPARAEAAHTPARVMTAETTGEVALQAPVATPSTPAPTMASDGAVQRTAVTASAQTIAPPPETTVTVHVERPAPTQPAARDDGPVTAATPAHAPMIETRGPLMPISEPARMAEAQPTEVIAQIRHAVERMGETQLDTVRVQLNPEHLGRIELQVSHTRDGALSVQVHAEQPQTVAMLEQHLTELRTTLSANQLDVRHVTVSAGTTGERRQQQPFPGKPAKVPIRGLQRAELDAAAAVNGPIISVYPTSRLALAGVDYRI
jgi:flagellar hook-length control protein FliK